MMQFDYPGAEDGNFEYVQISSVVKIGYQDGMPFVQVRCGCGRLVTLTEDSFWECSECHRDLEQLYFYGMRNLNK